MLTIKEKDDNEEVDNESKVVIKNTTTANDTQQPIESIKITNQDINIVNGNSENNYSSTPNRKYFIGGAVWLLISMFSFILFPLITAAIITLVTFVLYLIFVGISSRIIKNPNGNLNTSTLSENNESRSYNQNEQNITLDNKQKENNRIDLKP